MSKGRELGARFYRTPQNSVRFPGYEWFTSGICCLIFLDGSWLWVTEPAEDDPADKGYPWRVGLFPFCHSPRCLLSRLVASICISLLVSDGEQLFTCIFAIPVPLSWSVLFESFPIFIKKSPEIPNKADTTIPIIISEFLSHSSNVWASSPVLVLLTAVAPDSRWHSL